MTLFGLTMEQVLACVGMRIQFGTMAFLSCREAAFLNNCVNGRLVSSASRFQSSGYASLCAPNADKSLF